MPFTDDEVQGAVEKLVLGSIRRPLDTLGVRRSDVTFSDVQEATAGVFILYPLSPFYAVWLGTQRLRAMVEAEAAVVAGLRAMVGAVGRFVLPIDEVENLFNAKAALEALEGALATSAPTDISRLPSFQRFASNVSTFLVKNGSKIKQGGDIVPTPQEARVAIPLLVRQLVTLHGKMMPVIASIANSMSDYNSVNLPSLVARGVVSKARQVLGAHADALQALQPEERLASIRAVILDVVAAKAVVTKFGSFAGPEAYFSLTGTGAGYSDATHPSTPASLLTTIPAPYTILEGVNDELLLPMDGGANQTVTMGASIGARLNGGAVEQEFSTGNGYRIGDGVNPLDSFTPPENNELRLEVTDISGSVTDYNVPLTLSSDGTQATITGIVNSLIWTYGGLGTFANLTFQFAINGETFLTHFNLPANAADVISQINDSAGGRTVATLVANFVVLTGIDTYGAASSVQILGGSGRPALGFSIATYTGTASTPRTAQDVCDDINLVLVDSGFVAEPYYYPRHFQGTVDILSTGGATASFTLVSPTAGDMSNVVLDDTFYIASGPNAGLWDVVTTGSSSINMSKQIGSSTTETGVEVTAGPARRAIRIVATDLANQIPNEVTITVVGNSPLHIATGVNLGLQPFLTGICRPSTGKQLADDLNQRLPLLLTCSAPIVGTEVAITTNTTSFLYVILSKLLTTGDVVFTPGSPNSIEVAVDGAETAGVEVGDTLVLRGGTPANTNWLITAVSDTAVTATSSDAGVTGTGVTIEFGPTVTITRWQVLQISSGPLAGNYYVAGQGSSQLDVRLQSGMPLAKDVVTGLPIPATATLGDEFLLLGSKKKTVASAVGVDGASSGISTLFAVPPDTAYGTTPWFLLPQTVPGLSLGDLLEFYETDYKTPSEVFTITGIAGAILQVSPNVGSTQSYTFDEQAPPFARLQHGHLTDFQAYRDLLDAWVDAIPPSFFSNLNRYLNPILQNSQPTIEQIGTALNHLELLDEVLLESEALAADQPVESTLEYALKSYVVAPVPSLDTLIRSYVEKGADRAIDILLRGEFSQFFNLDVANTSYAGAMQHSMRLVMQNDLPIRSTARTNATHSRLRSSSISPDYEYDHSDIDPGAQVDPPAGSNDR